MKKAFLGLYIAAAAVCLLIIIFLASGFLEKVFASEEELLTTKIITPQEANSSLFRIRGRGGRLQGTRL